MTVNTPFTGPPRVIVTGTLTVVPCARSGTQFQILDLAPGTKLSEAALAAEFGLSATPVRDALSRLSQEGLVEVARGRGYTVATLTVADIRDICDARFALETGIVTLVSERMTDEHAQRLFALSVRTGDTSLSAIELIQRNQDFHVGMAKVTGSPRLVASARRIMEDSTRIFHLGLATFAEHGMQPGHDHLVEALRNGDLPAAFEACRREAYGTIERVVTNLLQSPWAPSMQTVNPSGTTTT
jgi:DNA-binding GntR family transcriptional regulator